MPFNLIAVDLDGTLLGGTEEGHGFLPEGIIRESEDEISQTVYDQNGYVAKNHYGRGVAEIINILFSL